MWVDGYEFYRRGGKWVLVANGNEYNDPYVCVNNIKSQAHYYRSMVNFSKNSLAAFILMYVYFYGIFGIFR